MENTQYATSIPEIDAAVDHLCSPRSLGSVWLQSAQSSRMPQTAVLREIMQRLRAILFPGYFGSSVTSGSVKYHIAANLDSVYHLLADQIRRGFTFLHAIQGDEQDAQETADRANACTINLIQEIPKIRDLLALDAQAAYEGDPAASSPAETIFCYPSLYAMVHHRIAHVLYENKVPLIPRMIQEMAHSHTGIDIHPGASIGSHFFIDHGTGVVIGETSIIGDHCRLYQGVTLGALSFPKNADGTLVKGFARHPILGNKVTVYAGATILGRIHIGDKCVIGGNVWVTEDIPEGSHVVQGKHIQ
ncbi:MAG: serine acetyltransferase [Desulfovibrionaceae bacterium]|nr:serine acetyltransferase [Desulfovibrionaceae bacterium]